MENIKLIELDEVDSTNRYLREYTGTEGRDMTVVTAEYQTAGRGQGTNTWESEPGQNLLFSLMIHPAGVPAARQFVLLESCALALVSALGHFAEGMTIKWPNDIYWNDCKISGTLSECDICGGMTARCIMGVGLNVNQREFRSDAPNPVSLRTACGTEVSRKEVLGLFISEFQRYMTMLGNGCLEDIHREYIGKMYRRNGLYEFEDSGGRFRAGIDTVRENGHLVLRREDGSLSEYAFKEVRFIINP